MLPVAGCVFFSKHLSLVRLFITVRCSTVFKGEREGRKAEESNKKRVNWERHTAVTVKLSLVRCGSARFCGSPWVRM